MVKGGVNAPPAKTSEASLLGRAGGRVDGILVLDLLADRLGGGSDQVQLVTARAVGQLGNVEPAREFIARLFTGLERRKWPAPETAGKALSELLVREGLTPELVAWLTELLRHNHWSVRWAAAGAIADLKKIDDGATPELVSQLINMLQDQRDVATKAAFALRAVATPQMVPALTQLLRHRDPRIREGAAIAVSGADSAATMPGTLIELANLLRDEDASVRWAALAALADMGTAAATPDIISRLPSLLQDQDELVRSAALRATAAFGGAAATKEVVRQVEHLCVEDNWQVQAYAVQALSALKGPTAAREEIVHLLRRSDRYSCTAALVALSRLGDTATTPEILDQVSKLLVGPYLSLRSEAARTAGNLRSTATPQILAGLQGLLRSQDSLDRSAAAWALGQLWNPTRLQAVLWQLAEMLNDDSQDVRNAVARSLGRLMGEGLRFFHGPSGNWLVRTISELTALNNRQGRGERS